MAIRDLFKPKYQNSNPEIRAKAVKKLNDSELLMNIALNDESITVCVNAVRNPNLMDHRILSTIYENSKYRAVQDEAYQKLTNIIENTSNQDLLVDIAKNNPKYLFRNKAVCKITSEMTLAEIAFNDSDERVRRSAIDNSNLTSQEVFVKVAEIDDSEYVRREALNRIFDFEKKAKLIKNDDSSYIRKQFIGQCLREDILEDFAQNDNDWEVQKEALYKLKEIRVDNLIENSKNIYNNDLKEFEKLNITTDNIYDLGDYEVLIILTDGTNITSWSDINETHNIKYISENYANSKGIIKEKYKYVKSLVGYEDYQDPATDYWKQDPIYSYEYNQLNAVVINGISDSITDLSKMFAHSHVKTISFNNCDTSNVKNINGIFYDCSYLEYLYGLETWNPSNMGYIYYLFDGCKINKKHYPKWYDYYNIPEVEDIEDKQLLEKIAKNDLNSYKRSNAVEKIVDEDVLIDLFSHEEDSSIRLIIVDKIDDEELLMQIVGNETDNNVRKKCFEKMNPEKISENIDYLLDIAKYGDYPENIKATLKINDEEALIDVALHAEESNGVKIAAIEKIYNQDVLEEILKNKNENRDVRIAAVKHVQNEEALFDIAKDIYDTWYVRIECVKRINNQNVLNSIAETNLNYNYDRRALENDDSVRVYAVEKVESCDVLKRIVNSRTRDKIKKSALENPNLDDVDFLIKIAKSTNDYSASAVKNPNLKDDNALVDIVENSIKKWTRYNALSKIEDQGVLMNFLKSKDVDIQSRVISKIDDVNTLEQNAMFNQSSEVRFNAIANPKFTNQELLIHFAKNNHEDTIRKLAVSKITDSDVLLEIYRNSNDDIKEEIIKNPHFTDESILIDYATAADFYGTRRNAVKNPNLKNQKVLLEILLNEKDFTVREEAIKKITDYDVLLKVLKEEKSQFVRQEAVELLNKDDLIYLVENDINEDVRQKAREKLETM